MVYSAFLLSLSFVIFGGKPGERRQGNPTMTDYVGLGQDVDVFFQKPAAVAMDTI